MAAYFGYKAMAYLAWPSRFNDCEAVSYARIAWRYALMSDR